MTEHEPNPADKVYGFGDQISALNRMRYLAGVADALGSVRLSAPFFKVVLKLLEDLYAHHELEHNRRKRLQAKVNLLQAKVKKLREEGKR